jgi:poly(hydroxyalkanoate) depolymerase family esterase
MKPFAERPDAAPAGVRLSEVSAFGPNPGALRMLTYKPPGLRPGAPLVVLLHGCGQSAEALAVGSGWIDLADRRGFALLCPEQTRGNNRGRCFNWFQPIDVRREGGEAASIRRMIDHFSAHARLDQRRVFITGLSAGGSMALAMLATAPELFAAGAVIAGVAYGAASSPGDALLAMTLGTARSPASLADAVRRASRHAGPWPRLAVWQGLADRTVAPANARRIVAQWVDLLGLDPTPSEVDALAGQTVSRWRNSAGRAVLELHLVEGMAHGAPLAATGPDGLGREGPFLLETGLSSTQEIARSWGLLDQPKPPREPTVKPSPNARPAAPRERRSLGGRLLALVRRLLR